MIHNFMLFFFLPQHIIFVSVQHVYGRFYLPCKIPPLSLLSAIPVFSIPLHGKSQRTEHRSTKALLRKCCTFKFVKTQVSLPSLLQANAEHVNLAVPFDAFSKLTSRSKSSPNLIWKST